jgi:hypothetical protein
MGVPAECVFHQSKLPDVGTLNRVCVNFEPNADYERYNGRDFPAARRFTWFREDLEPRVLYVFHYNAPDSIEQRLPLVSTPLGRTTEAT